MENEELKNSVAESPVQPAQDDNKEVKESQSEESVQDRNWKAFREKREQDRKAAEDAKKLAEQEKRMRIEKEKEAAALKAALEAAFNKQAQPDPFFEDENEQEKKLEAIFEKKMAERERKLQEEHKKKEMENLPVQLTKIHKDFNEVCSRENLDYLDYYHPEVVKGYEYMPDSIEKWSAVYNLVKKFVPNVEAKKEAAKAEKNLMKPQSSGNAAGQATAMGAPHVISDQKKHENWLRMKKIMNSIN